MSKLNELDLCIAALKNIMILHDANKQELRKSTDVIDSAIFFHSARFDTIACEALHAIGVVSADFALQRMSEAVRSVGTTLEIMKADIAEQRSTLQKTKTE